MPLWKRTGLAALAAAGLMAHAVTAARSDDGSADNAAGQTQATPNAAATGTLPPAGYPINPMMYGGYPAGPYGQYCPPKHHGLKLPKALALFSPFGKIYPPGYGWSRPVRYPIYRLPVHYQKYWPNFWYGQPGVYTPPAPMVYQPTDTTQLGFYYQRVPYWQPNPTMVPQFRPWPEQWHYREKPMYGSSYLAAYGPGGTYANPPIAPMTYAAPAGAWPAGAIPAPLTPAGLQPGTNPAGPAALDVNSDAPSGAY